VYVRIEDDPHNFTFWSFGNYSNEF